MKKKKFVRTDFRKYSKLGVRRKNKQKYRKGKGIDNKMRLNIKGHLKKVSMGFKNMKKTRGLVKELKPIMIKNLNDLKNLEKSEVGIIAKIGDKKRKEIAEYAIKNNIKLYLDPKKTLNRIEEKLRKTKEKQIKRKLKVIERDKKAQKEAEKKAKKEAKVEKKENKEAKGKTKIEEKENKKTKEEIKTEEKENKEAKIKEPKEMIKNDKNKKEIQTNNYGRGK
jgi:large subunit ribosomal protein L32e